MYCGLLSKVCARVGQGHCFASHKKAIAKAMKSLVSDRHVPSQAQGPNLVFQVINKCILCLSAMPNTTFPPANCC